jgi:hypothetical protein
MSDMHLSIDNMMEVESLKIMSTSGKNSEDFFMLDFGFILLLVSSREWTGANPTEKKFCQLGK